MESVDKQSVQETLAVAAWLLSEQPPSDITAIAQRIAGPEWGRTRDDIVAGLVSLSDQYYVGSGAEYCCIGHCLILGDDCYWWHNGAETDWSSDRPEWWADQIAQW